MDRCQGQEEESDDNRDQLKCLLEEAGELQTSFSELETNSNSTFEPV